MRIFDGQTELPLPQWITVSESTLSVKTNTGKVNGLHGDRLIGDEYYSSRVLKCSGTIITDDYPLVEKERSRLHDMLAGRLLQVYRDDSDQMFYECILDGSINSSYYNGQTISKAFTISFNLKTLQPFGCGRRMLKTNRIYQKKKIVVQGNDTVYPAVFFCGQKRYDKELLVCNGRSIALKNPVYLRKDESLFYSQCHLSMSRNGSNELIGVDRSGEQKTVKEFIDISAYMTDAGITMPLYLNAGVNELFYYSGGTCMVLYHDVYK